MPPLTLLEFFASAGLVPLDLEPAWSCTWANDIGPRKQAVNEICFGTGEFLLGDIGHVSVSSLPYGADMAWVFFRQDLPLAGGRRVIRPNAAAPLGSSGS